MQQGDVRFNASRTTGLVLRHVHQDPKALPVTLTTYSGM